MASGSAYLQNGILDYIGYVNSSMGNYDNDWLDADAQDIYYLGGEMWVIFLSQLSYVRAHSVISYHGNPTDGQTCAGSKAIGDYVGLFNNGSGQKSETAASANPIVGDPHYTVVSGSQYATSTNIMGWVYKDGDGHYWVQGNASIAPSWSASVSAWFASIGVTPANVANPKYSGTTPPKLPQGESYATCWPESTNGGALYG